MPNVRELTRMFKDVQELVPAIVGAILAIVTALGILIPGLDGGSRNNAGTGNGGPTNSLGGFSKPEAAGPNYLTNHERSYSASNIKSGYAVTVNGKDYEKSILSTDGAAEGSSVSFSVADTAQALVLSAAWADDIPNSGGTGKVLVKRDGQVLDRFSVEVGEVVKRKINVRGGGTVEIYLNAVDHTPDKEAVAASGLAILTPVLK